VYYKAKPSSLVWSSNIARALAATAMHADRRGIARRGMGIGTVAVAKQIGDLLRRCAPTTSM